MRRAVPALLAALAMAAPAQASKTQESIFMDDPKIVYSAPDKLEGTLREIQRLGADSVRVSVFWRLLAPNSDSTAKPFGPGGGSDPRNYAAEKWDRYDLIVTTAKSLGLGVIFDVTSPAPHWATGNPPDPPPRPDIKDSYRPSPDELKDFVKALGTRYSGTFADEAVRTGSAGIFGGPCDPVPTIPLPPAVCPPDETDPTPENPNPPNTGPLLPRVDAWSIWNEPNQPGWLTPQWHEDSNKLPAAPHVYRELADAMYSGLQETGHGSDTILLAETAPKGSRARSVTSGIAPLLFVRELYCLNRKLKHYKGSAARARGCPKRGKGFAADHPVLFGATGFAHHPYAFLTAPSVSDRVRDHAVLADLGRLTKTLDKAFRRHGSKRRIPIWLTEYGYQTDPPDPYAGTSWRKQASYLAEAEWMAYRRGRVKSTAQFLLYDDQPLRLYDEADPRYWGTFQTGLRAEGGKRKKAYRGYQRTIHVQRRGRRVTVFGLYRPAAERTRATVEVKSKNSWRVLRRQRTNAAGFTKLTLKRPGRERYRIGFETGGGTRYSRSVAR